VYGADQSFFTRKLEGALAYEAVPFRRRLRGRDPRGLRRGLARRQGKASLVFAGGPSRELAVTPFLANARRVLLARYAAMRCEALDAVHERAGGRAALLRRLHGRPERAARPPRGSAPPARPPFAPPFEAEG
jgi:hypothetical protein